MHVPMEMLKASAGFRMVHIPYTGAGPALLALLGGQVDAAASGPSTVAQQIKAGKLRALAHWGDKPLVALPDVPSLKQAGYAAQFAQWSALFVPAGTPDAPEFHGIRKGWPDRIGEILASAREGWEMVSSRLTRFWQPLAVAAGALVALAAHATEPLPLAELAKPGRVLMLRHANAPGTGDPVDFKLGDCSTQRNLDAAGRAQAAQLGQRLAKAGVTRAKVYSSQWCRCVETARLLKLGPVSELPALNSFFGRTQDRDANLAALRAFIAALPGDGPPVVLVTHQFTISAFTGAGTASGGGTLFETNASGAPRVLGQIRAD